MFQIRERLRIAEEDVIPAAYLDLLMGGQTLADREDQVTITHRLVCPALRMLSVSHRTD